MIAKFHSKTPKFCKQEKSAYLWKIIHGKHERIEFQSLIKKYCSVYVTAKFRNNR